MNERRNARKSFVYSVVAMLIMTNMNNVSSNGNIYTITLQYHPFYLQL